MRVSAINVNYPSVAKAQKIQKQNLTNYSEPTFSGKNQYAKLGAGIAGGLGTLGAIGGLLIMTGGLALPAILAYGGTCAAIGAGVGHQIDKDIEKNPDDYKDKD